MTSHPTLRGRFLAKCVAGDFAIDYGSPFFDEEKIADFIESELSASATKIREEDLAILTSEIAIAHTTPELAGGKTSRLTSAYNRISALLPSEGDTNTPQGNER